MRNRHLCEFSHHTSDFPRSSPKLFQIIDGIPKWFKIKSLDYTRAEFRRSNIDRSFQLIEFSNIGICYRFQHSGESSALTSQILNCLIQIFKPDPAALHQFAHLVVRNPNHPGQFLKQRNPAFRKFVDVFHLDTRCFRLRKRTDQFLYV